jgi:hypothetical protein
MPKSQKTRKNKARRGGSDPKAGNRVPPAQPVRRSRRHAVNSRPENNRYDPHPRVSSRRPSNNRDPRAGHGHPF